MKPFYLSIFIICCFANTLFAQSLTSCDELDVSVSVNRTAFHIGDLVVYTIRVKNKTIFTIGNTNDSYVRMYYVPSGLQYVSSTGFSGMSSNNPGVTFYTNGTISAGTERTYTITYSVQSIYNSIPLASGQDITCSVNQELVLPTGNVNFTCSTIVPATCSIPSISGVTASPANICAGAKSDISVNFTRPAERSDVDYAWSSNDIIPVFWNTFKAFPTTTAIYTVTVSNTNACTVSATVNISIINPYGEITTSLPYAACSSLLGLGFTPFTPNNNLQYLWSNNQETTSSITLVPVNGNTTYTVTVTDIQTGCTATASKTLFSNVTADGNPHYVFNTADVGGITQTYPTVNIHDLYWTNLFPPNIKGDIIIPAGYRLHINGTAANPLVVNMPANSKIIVEPGARLYINNAKITSCATWKGIEVQSDPTKPNWYSYYGTVFIKNTLIENAEIGIVAGTNEGGIGSGEGRGYVQCIHTTFRNNWYDVWLQGNSAAGNGYYYEQNFEDIYTDQDGQEFTFGPFYAPRYFDKCLFQTDNNFRFPIDPDQLPVHLVAIQNNGIKIAGCDFINENTELERKGAGILTLLSAYEIGSSNDPNTEPGSSFARNTIPRYGEGRFNGLEYGIYSLGEMPNQVPYSELAPCSIYAQSFENCMGGIYASGFEEFGVLAIHNNKFKNSTYGTYLETVSSFKFNDNTMTNCFIGSIMNKTGMDDNGDGVDNKVYNNTFDKCFVGAAAMQNNSGNQKGLEYKCNTFSNGYYADIWVYGYDENGVLLPNTGIGTYQGKVSAADTRETANNRFTNSNYQILLESLKPIIYTHTADAPSKPIPTKVGVLENVNAAFTVNLTDPAAGGRITLNPKNFNYDSSLGACPAGVVPTKIQTIAEGWQERSDALMQKGILENSLNTLRDGGNTPLLKNEVAMTQLQNAYTLYAKLLAKTPYISEDVLEELAKQEAFPKTLLRNVLVANKHAGKDAKVWANLSERTDELPNYMLEQIKQAAESGLSGKEFLELAVGEQKARYHNAVQGQIELLDADSTATAADYDAVLASAEGLGYQMRLVKKYSLEGNDVAANAVLSDIPNRVVMSADEASNYADYVTMFPIEQRLKTQPFDSLSNAERQSLAVLAGNQNAAQVKARAITEHLNKNRTYHEALPVIAQSRTSLPRTRRNKNVTGRNDTPSIVTIMPNPANQYFSIETFGATDAPTTLNIYNAQGVLVQSINPQLVKTISTTEWAVGGYFYEYAIEGVVTQRGKLQIIR
jgi:Domain of unknown function DUF11